MTDRRQAHLTMAHRVKALTHLTSEQLVGADGSIWSHAATLGTRIKGTEFTIDQAVVENFVRVFTTGYPCKVPVDYEHGTVNGATSTGQPVPKAGDVLELKGVFATSDFAGELQTTAEKLSALADRPLDDPRNLGLWMRWKPTSRALGMIQGGEYSELSIAFAPVPHNTTGADQGEVLISVALTNLPFLDDMLPVAASRSFGTTPASPPDNRNQDKPMSQKLTLLSVAAAMLAKPLTDEDHAVTELTAFGNEVRGIREYAAIVGAEVGETDPAKAVTFIRQLKATNATLTEKAKTEQKARILTGVEAFLKQHEKRIASVPLRAMFSRQLAAELEAAPDTKVEETETAKTISSLPETGTTTRVTGADVSTETSSDPDVQLDRVARGLLESDAELKELSRKDWAAAYDRAIDAAAKQIKYTSPQMERVRGALTAV